MLLKDTSYAARMMRRTPLFTAAVVMTVALAIASTTTMFSVVNAVILRPLPFRAPNRIVQIAEKNYKLNLASFGASALNFLSWREQAQSFQSIAAVEYTTFTLTGKGEPEQLSGNRISPALTRLLGLSPLAGRAFTDDEEKPNAAPVAILGEGLWKRRFGGNPAIIGRTIVLNDTPTTVVGIAPAALNLISGGDIYSPLTIDPAKEIRLNHVIFVIGRLKDGVSFEQAQAEMNAISARMGQQYPEIRDWGIRLITLFDTFVSPQLKTGLLVLLWAVALVLLIACANIANLLLAHAAARQGEMAVRSAIGASRTRLLRQLMVESVALSLAGGVIGILGAFWAVNTVNHLLPPNTLPVPKVEMGATVLWFALGSTILTGLLFGIMPAWRTARVDLNAVLKQGGRGSAGRVSARLRNGLAIGELAMATVLLMGAGLFIQSLANLERVHLGFASKGLITFQLAPPVAKYPLESKAPRFYRELLDSLQSLPGVRGAAISSGIPFGAGNFTTHPMFTSDHSVLPPGTPVPIDWRIVSPGYFKTMEIPLLRSTVLTQESPALYYPMAARLWPLMDVVVRTDGSPEALLPAIRQRVHELDSEMALANERTMDEWLSITAAQPRLNSELLTVFAAIALLIAAIGIYGVLSYSVSQRTAEIGVRIALGATRDSVLYLIVGEGMKVAALGIGIGLLGGLALGRAVSSLVFGVPVRDPVTFTTVAVALAAVAFAACALPALRASRVDPMVALRHE